MTCPNLSELVWASPQYSDHVRLSRSHFLHSRMLLFFSLTSYPGEIAYFNSPNGSFPMVYELWRCIEVKLSILLGAHAKRLSKERASSAVCLSYILSGWKLHISTQVIDSFPLTYGMRRCALENLSIPLEAHREVQWSKIFLSFQPKN